MNHMQTPLRISSSKITPIIHLFLFASTGHIFLFQRNCGTWGPISGEIERFENPIGTACRETKEEIDINIGQVYLTDYYFFGISKKGKRIHGITCYAPLPENIPAEAFTFNNEISGSLRVPPNDALSILKKKGFPEAVSGFEYLRAKQLI